MSVLSSPKTGNEKRYHTNSCNTTQSSSKAFCRAAIAAFIAVIPRAHHTGKQLHAAKAKPFTFFLSLLSFFPFFFWQLLSQILVTATARDQSDPQRTPSRRHNLFRTAQGFENHSTFLFASCMICSSACVRACVRCRWRLYLSAPAHALLLCSQSSQIGCHLSSPDTNRYKLPSLEISSSA